MHIKSVQICFSTVQWGVKCEAATTWGILYLTQMMSYMIKNQKKNHYHSELCENHIQYRLDTLQRD